VTTTIRTTFISPAEAARAVGTNARITVGFEKAINLSTVSVNTQDSACTGSVKISANNFASCVRMATQAISLNGDKYLRFTPASNLSANTQYKISVIAGAKAQDGSPLDQAYTSTLGFRTGAGPDMRAPDIDVTASFLYPYDGETNVPTNAGVYIAFVNEPIDPATATASTASTACAGSIQLTRDNFASCLPFRAEPTIVQGGRTLSLYPKTGLAASTNYKLRFTNAITDPAGNAVTTTTTSFATGSGTSTTAPGIYSLNPDNGASNEYVTTYFTLDLDAAMDPSTVLANFEDSSCSGSFQVSNDNFSTCVRMTRNYLVSPGFNQFIFYPENPLAYSSSYKIRMTNAAKNVYETAAVTATQTIGFSMQAGVTGGTIINYLIPLDNSQLNEILLPFAVNFSKPMQAATVTVNTTNTTCAGYSLQVSIDSFTTCLIMQAQPSVTANNTHFTVYPTSPLNAGATYRTRITTAALDFGGTPVTVYNGSGIMTRP